MDPDRYYEMHGDDEIRTAVEEELLARAEQDAEDEAYERALRNWESRL